MDPLILQAVQMADDFRKQVHELTDQLSAIRASAEWLQEVRERDDPAELRALRDILEAVTNALRKTDAFRKVSETLTNAGEAASVFSEIRGSEIRGSEGNGGTKD
jgi:hypothetical protein